MRRGGFLCAATLPLSGERSAQTLARAERSARLKKAAQSIYNDSMPKKAIKPILAYCVNLAGRVLKPKRIRQIKYILRQLLQPLTGQGRIHKARQAMERQDWDAARKLWAEARRRKPAQPTAYVEGAKTLSHCRRENDAAELLLHWFKQYGTSNHSACATAAMLIANHAASATLQERMFGKLVHVLAKSDAGSYILFDRLFAVTSAINWQQQPHQYAPFRAQLQRVWSELPRDDSNTFWFGLALGFVDEELTAAQVERLLQLEFGKLGWLLCEHPFHTKTIASFRAYAQALTDNPVPDYLPETSRRKLGVLLTVIDYALLNRLRQKLLPMTKQTPTRSDAARPKRKIRIAVCVSGQLRGYRRTFASWRNLGLENHDADYFVHVWKRIGRKIPRTPSKDQLQRIFAEAFGDAYAEALRRYGVPELEHIYPELSHYFVGGGDYVTQAELQRFYHTDAVVVEDDAAAPFRDFNNPGKMYYKVEQAYNLAMESGKDYDLIVRMRPDKGISPHTVVDWGEIYEDCERNAIVFADGGTYLTENLAMADQVACGTGPGMAAYSTAFSKTNSEQGLISEFLQPARFRAHRNFAYALLEEGFRVKPLSKAGVRWGPLHDPERLPTSAIKALLQQDINDRKRHELDAVFLAAVEKDLAAER